VIEIRHYVNRVGKDVFDDWLTQLGDARAQAKIAIRINRLAAGNFGDCKSLRQGCSSYGSIGDLATVSITG
jgi:putative addiction module killer protein